MLGYLTITQPPYKIGSRLGKCWIYFQHINISNVTAGYGRFSDLIRFLRFLITCFKSYTELHQTFTNCVLGHHLWLRG